MPTYRVGVLLTASGGSFQRGMRAAAGTTRKTQSALQRAGGSATAFGHRTDEAGRRAQSALQRASGSVRGLGSALQRTSNQARQTGSAIDAAAGRSDRKVRGLIQRFRDLGRAIRESGAGAQGGAGGGGIGGGAISRAVALAGGGYALTRAAGQELALDDRFNRLGVDTGKDDTEVQEIRRHIESGAGRAGIPVSELLASVEEYVGRTGDLQTAMANLETTAQAIQRLGAAGVDIGAMSAQLRKGGIRGGDEFREAILAIVESEREGALKGRDLARTAAEAMSLMFAIPGQQGLPALRDFLVLAQMGMVGTGDPNKSMTALRSVLSAGQDPEKLKKMKQLGVYGASRRSPLPVVRELVASTGGDMTKLGGIYELEGRAIPAMFTTEEGTDVGRRVEEGMRNVDEGRFEAETERLADQATAKMNVARDRAQSLFSRAFGGVMQDVVTQVTAHQDAIMTGALAALGGRALWRGGRGGLDAWRRWRGGGESDGATGGRGRGGGLGAPGLVRTMHVTTLIAGRTVGGGRGGVMGGGGVGGGGGAAQRAGGGGGARARTAGRAGQLLQRAGGVARRVPVLGLALGGLSIAGALSENDNEGAAVRAGGVAGGIAGGAGGAAVGGFVGGALGSVVPVLGTAIGAGIGSTLGGILGSYFGAGLGADDAASALERAAAMDVETRDSRRREARRQWRAAEAGEGEPAAGEEEPAAGEEAAGEEEPASALERAANMDADTRADRRREARRQWRAAEAGKGGDVATGPEEEPEADVVSRDQLRRDLRSRFRGGGSSTLADNRQIDQSVHIDAPVFNIQSTTGNTAEIAEELVDQLDEKISRRQREREERIVDLTYSDPDPTLLF